MSNQLKCPKCSGRMEQGFVLDNTYGARLISHWVPGEPKKSFWMGTKAPDTSALPIGVFRCSSCGFLEQYAGHKFAAQ
jgi:hypothetical protein